MGRKSLLVHPVDRDAVVIGSVDDERTKFGGPCGAVAADSAGELHPPGMDHHHGCIELVPVERTRREHSTVPGLPEHARRALSVAVEVGGVALAIDAKNERAAVWYERFGALRLLDDRLKLILPLKTIADALTLARRG
jgi:hypothetical protein